MLPLYSSLAASEIDRAFIAAGTSGYSLMRRAGQALFDHLRAQYSECRSLVIVCGGGNNAGDGYVLARLAKGAGMEVTVLSLVAPDNLHAEAAMAARDWLLVGEVIDFDADILERADVIVDAMLGIGLDRDVEGRFEEVIQMINEQTEPVISVDIPSGLDADTGRIRGIAVEATDTVTFIVRKQGMYTAYGRQCCGRIHYDDLAVPSTFLAGYEPSAHVIEEADARLPLRKHNSHKSRYGCVLIIGGNTGMAGAVALAARAALVAGAGLVRVVTRPEHIAIVTHVCPEAMVYGSINGELPEGITRSVTHILIGCGLGLDPWAHRLLHQVSESRLPVIYDADALNLVAELDLEPSNAVAITPHPGEAARLLIADTHSIQRDRFRAVRKLAAQYGCIAVLKGSGTLICEGAKIAVCDQGGPAMASAGMGDVLAGILAATLAQRLEPMPAAMAAVMIHAQAGDIAADGRTRGIRATDLIDHLLWVLE